MRSKIAFATVVAAALAFGATTLVADNAQAHHSTCKKLGFSVNDYGKEGPIRDAKALLDDHIKRWTAAQGISSYRVGEKSVSCELYLDLIVFDEHTCTATANVCW